MDVRALTPRIALPNMVKSKTSVPLPPGSVLEQRSARLQMSESIHAPQEVVDIVLSNLHDDLPSKGIFSCIEVFTVPPPSRSGHTFKNLLDLLPGISTDYTDIAVHDISQTIPPFSHFCELFDWRYFSPHVQDALVQYWQTSQIVDFDLEDIYLIVFEGRDGSDWINGSSEASFSSLVSHP
ncbi:uncharacterized protein BT62DRAFT_1003368 [Guyanagaster necrorhizus]|uniref:Uncharacterized protein n=1 Tax=Guyanagaster necrorhizus TaxID=856835 RepID=A0A9P8AUV7_9AGAR|nr:uncharacterized protein BT62DRAFT_1003368 [Guyanagaster necrorhizus MCA 3950]KAG7448655.1 hypothetical protein BT62DRAFT_1003368 [Guyanagaster necrorhizus MCA 3950]